MSAGLEGGMGGVEGIWGYSAAHIWSPARDRHDFLVFPWRLFWAVISTYLAW